MTWRGSDAKKRISSGRILLIGGVVALIAATTLVLGVGSLRWRAQLVALHLTGQIHDIELTDLLRFLSPGSRQSLAHLVETRNAYAVIQNFDTSPADISAGGKLFETHCASCHGRDASGNGDAPRLTGRAFKHGSADWAIYRTIRFGVANTRMGAHPFAPKELWQLVAYLRSIDRETVEASASPCARVRALTASDLLAVDEPEDDWPTYSGAYRSTRRSRLTDITPDNVHQLALRWMVPLSDVSALAISSPLVRDGVMYVMAPSSLVIALDAATGAELWRYQRSTPASQLTFGVDGPNRGLALLGDKIFFGARDAHVIALSAVDGKVVWDVPTTNEKNIYYISSAPLAVRDMIVVGVGTKQGGRGYIVALDEKTGKERWRFVAIPGPNEPGNDTWSGDSWRNGGAPTWLTGSYDAKRDTIYWGTGNPKPDYDTALRRGDNLYSNSVVALEGATGRLKWHFQFTPADERDWDSNQIPVLATLDGTAGPEERVLFANRNGFYYVLDRDTGRFISATPFVRQNWTDGIDAKGRPLPRSDLVRSREGTLVYPGNGGGTNWWTPSYDADLGLFFVPAIEQGMVYFASAASWPRASNRNFYTAVRALDARTGKQVWEYTRPPRLDNNTMAGVMTTQSGVLFGGDDKTFFALGSRTGELLWSVDTGAIIKAAPVTYRARGTQFVAMAAGSMLMVFALPEQAQAKRMAKQRGAVKTPVVLNGAAGQAAAREAAGGRNEDCL